MSKITKLWWKMFFSFENATGLWKKKKRIRKAKVAFECTQLWFTINYIDDKTTFCSVVLLPKTICQKIDHTIIAIINSTHRIKQNQIQLLIYNMYINKLSNVHVEIHFHLLFTFSDLLDSWFVFVFEIEIKTCFNFVYDMIANVSLD